MGVYWWVLACEGERISLSSFCVCVCVCVCVFACLLVVGTVLRLRELHRLGSCHSPLAHIPHSRPHLLPLPLCSSTARPLLCLIFKQIVGAASLISPEEEAA